MSCDYLDILNYEALASAWTIEEASLDELLPFRGDRWNGAQDAFYAILEKLPPGFKLYLRHDYHDDMDASVLWLDETGRRHSATVSLTCSEPRDIHIGEAPKRCTCGDGK